MTKNTTNYYMILVNGQPMQPKGGKPYKYRTEQEALKSKWNLYGACNDVKVKCIENNPVIPSKIKTS